MRGILRFSSGKFSGRKKGKHNFREQTEITNKLKDIKSQNKYFKIVKIRGMKVTLAVLSDE